MSFPKSNLFFEEEKSPWEVVGEGIQRQIVGYDDTVMMVNVKFEKGGIGSLHHHRHTQVTHIAEGTFAVTIEEETKILKKGDSFYIPSNKIHGVVCLEAGILIDVFSPIREDFMK
ncbi:cupin domain-containing protein [Flavobacterium hiemivividum]|uniref:Cupin domain-containing protein n=1 Tax=Flavobacterium hiemivividum TaxID=2541734 RepID=A0A4R5CLP6_9FLAO|nr:cupin domain-containing protein [Flavobacterium hiemivividum]TDE01272.1 cupin domain-containing protein [Flavobacterium hiemivividum]